LHRNIDAAALAVSRCRGTLAVPRGDIPAAV